MGTSEACGASARRALGPDRRLFLMESRQLRTPSPDETGPASSQRHADRACAADGRGPYVDSANDNASAVACALGLAEHLKTEPLEHTEVWLAFTGAEEVGCLGIHALLGAYSETLRDAWFLDFEMVSTDEIAYVTLRSRGYRGLCLAGFGDDGWLANWHQTTDDTAHLVSAGLEKATTFAWRMLQALEADPM